MSTLIEKISEAIRPVKSLKALRNDKGKVTVTYVGEDNPESILKAEVIFTPAALERKIELQGYKRIETDNSIRKPLMIELFGKTELSVAEASSIRKTAKFFNEIVKELSIIEAPKTPKSEFIREKQKAQAKIQNVKAGKNKAISLEDAVAELEAVYTKYGEVYKPRKK